MEGPLRYRAHTLAQFCGPSSWACSPHRLPCSYDLGISSAVLPICTIHPPLGRDCKQHSRDTDIFSHSLQCHSHHGWTDAGARSKTVVHWRAAGRSGSNGGAHAIHRRAARLIAPMLHAGSRPKRNDAGQQRLLAQHNNTKRGAPSMTSRGSGPYCSTTHPSVVFSTLRANVLNRAPSPNPAKRGFSFELSSFRASARNTT